VNVSVKSKPKLFANYVILVAVRNYRIIWNKSEKIFTNF
jgi:hypothetical protein